jgi:hypothetical protein
MEELSKQLSERIGIDQGLAEKISALLQGKTADMPNLLAGDGQGLVQMLQRGGIDEGIARKVLTFLKDNSGQLSEWLKSGGILEKAKGMFAGMMSGKKE